MTGSLLITAFGPFGRFKHNPSEVLVCGLNGYPVIVLPVSYDAVDEFIERGVPKRTTRLLMLGVGPATSKLRVEKVARNWVGAKADVRNVARGPGPIDPTGPEKLEGRLFAAWNHQTKSWKPSRNAGCYLCNYLYYQALRKHPGLTSGFIHVPPFSALPEELQRRWLTRILAKLEKST